MYYFHVSFYSETCDCWDKVGWYMHTIALCLMLIVIPVYCNVVMCMSFVDFGSNLIPYQQLIVCYVCSTSLASIRMLIDFKKLVIDTWTWHKERRKNHSNRIVIEEKAGNSMSQIQRKNMKERDEPFLSYIMGEGEG